MDGKDLPNSTFLPTHLLEGEFEASGNLKHSSSILPVNPELWWTSKRTFGKSFSILVELVKIEAAFDDGEYLCRVRASDNQEALVVSNRLALVLTIVKEFTFVPKNTNEEVVRQAHEWGFLTNDDSGYDICITSKMKGKTHATYPPNTRFALVSRGGFFRDKNSTLLVGNILHSSGCKREPRMDYWLKYHEELPEIPADHTNFQEQISRVQSHLSKNDHQGCSRIATKTKITTNFKSDTVSVFVDDEVLCLARQESSEGQTLVMVNGNTGWVPNNIFEDWIQSRALAKRNREVMQRTRQKKMQREKDANTWRSKEESPLISVNPVTDPSVSQVAVEKKPDDRSAIQENTGQQVIIEEPKKEVVESLEKKNSSEIENNAQQSVTDVLANTPLRTAIDNLKRILKQDNSTKNLNIRTAINQLEEKIKIVGTDQQVRLDAIRAFESACGIDLCTKIGQAAALVVVMGVGFVLGVVIGEAIGTPLGAWDDMASATLKIIETFSGTITDAALVVLGGAALVSISSPILTYQTFFKPTEAVKAAEKVASEFYRDKQSLQK